MRVGAASAHFGCHPDRLHDLLVARTLALGGARVALDAVRALRGMRHGDGNELLGDRGQRAVGENRPTETLESFVGFGSKLLSPRGELRRTRRKQLSVMFTSPQYSLQKADAQNGDGAGHGERRAGKTHGE